jgi:two-component system sensor histidine kinase YesM
MKGTVFSRRLVLVYTLIVMIPLAVLVLVATEFYRAGEYKKLIDGAWKRLADYDSHIRQCVDLVYRLESLIAGNNGVADLFFFTDLSDPLPVVLQTRAVSDELERLQVSLPSIYGIRIFVQDRWIPERWPVFFHERRLTSSPGERWRHGFRSTLMGDLETGGPLTAFSTELLYSRRRIGELQILMRSEDFFPFLFRAGEPAYRNYVFHRGRPVPGLPQGGEFPPALGERILAAAAENPEGTLRPGVEGGAEFFVWRSIPGMELLLVQQCFTGSIRENIGLFRFTTGLGIVVSTVLLALIIRFATQKLMNRLYIIMEGMREVQKGNLNLRLSVEGNDEIAGMARIFTGMVGRIKDLIAEIGREQQLVTATEIRAMQNQINAHFLFNVLESIKMQAELKNEDSIVQSLTLLGKMLRYCLRREPYWVSLREELEYIRSYIALLNIRNDYTIRLHTDLEEGALDHEIPKMLIQPVIENAFLHGIEPRGEDAVIRLRVRADRREGALWISVRDTGAGMGEEALARLKALLASPPPENAAGGIGLLNIQERLSAFYGPAWRLRIKSEAGKGTEVSIPLPLNPVQEAPCP